jgi:hypothetical protein
LAFINPFYLLKLFIDYSLLAIIFNIPENYKKDIIKRIIVVLSVKIDLELIKVRFNLVKLIKAIKLITAILQNQDFIYIIQN